MWAERGRNGPGESSNMWHAQGKNGKEPSMRGSETRSEAGRGETGRAGSRRQHGLPEEVSTKEDFIADSRFGRGGRENKGTTEEEKPAMSRLR